MNQAEILDGRNDAGPAKSHCRHAQDTYRRKPAGTTAGEHPQSLHQPKQHPHSLQQKISQSSNRINRLTGSGIGSSRQQRQLTSNVASRSRPHQPKLRSERLPQSSSNISDTDSADATSNSNTNIHSGSVITVCRRKTTSLERTRTPSSRSTAGRYQIPHHTFDADNDDVQQNTPKNIDIKIRSTFSRRH